MAIVLMLSKRVLSKRDDVMKWRSLPDALACRASLEKAGTLAEEPKVQPVA